MEKLNKIYWYLHFHWVRQLPRRPLSFSGSAGSLDAPLGVLEIPVYRGSVSWWTLLLPLLLLWCGRKTTSRASPKLLRRDLEAGFFVERVELVEDVEELDEEVEELDEEAEELDEEVEELEELEEELALRTRSGGLEGPERLPLLGTLSSQGLSDGWKFLISPHINSLRWSFVKALSLSYSQKNAFEHVVSFLTSRTAAR